MSTFFPISDDGHFDNNIILPSNYSIDGYITTMRFEQGDICLTAGLNRYTLLESEDNYIKFDSQMNMIFKTNNGLQFIGLNGIIVTYTPNQIAKFDGVMDKIRDFCDDPFIRLEDYAHNLTDDILEWHRDTLVNELLEKKDFKRLKELVENGIV